MRIFLSVLFIALYFGNNAICEYVYPEASTIHKEWIKYSALKDIIYEIMFLIALLLPNRTNVSGAIIAGAIILVIGSIIDKALQGVYSYHWHDAIVVICALLVSIVTYVKWKKKESLSE